ncbi:MAG: tetratricopeptide repeat protein [Caulobacterales bacterium]
MRIILAALCLALVVACSPGAKTAPADPVLERLFTQLSEAPDAAAAAPIEQQIWERWAASGSPTVDILLERAAAAEAAGDKNLAVDFLSQASELMPRYAEPWNRRASLAYEAHDYSGAITAIQQTLEREPRHFGAMAALGLIYEELGQEKAALDAFRAALAVHPNFEAAKRGVQRLEPKIDGQDA